jgi:methylenetetrahydrofolate reductase (NADPH)
MPITDLGKIKDFTDSCWATIPARVTRRFEKHLSSAADMKKAGIEVASKQCADLIAHGVRNLHFLTLNTSDTTTRIINNLKLQKGSRKRPECCRGLIGTAAQVLSI